MRVIDEKGIECPRCKMEMQVRAHTHLKEKQLKQPYYFSKWYYCLNRSCAVTTHMVEEYKVYNRNDMADFVKMEEEYEGQLSFLKSL